MIIKIFISIIAIVAFLYIVFCFTAAFAEMGTGQIVKFRDIKHSRLGIFFFISTTIAKIISVLFFIFILFSIVWTVLGW